MTGPFGGFGSLKTGQAGKHLGQANFRVTCSKDKIQKNCSPEGRRKPDKYFNCIKLTEARGKQPLNRAGH